MKIDAIALSAALAEATNALDDNGNEYAACSGIVGNYHGRAVRLTLEPVGNDWMDESLLLTGHEDAILG